jgi:hypothetical protein
MIGKGKGGANTLTGLNFEKKVDFTDLIRGIKGYSIKKSSNKAGLEVFFHGNLVARCFKKHDFYKFLEENGMIGKELFQKSYCRTMRY